jgi:CRP-like cAMP-binding protein
MSIPSYLERPVAEHGTLTDEVLLSLARVLANQNAILDDTIHTELQRIADQQERIARALESIGNRLGV